MNGRFRAAALISIGLAAGAAGGAFWASARAPEEDPAARWPEDAPVPLDVARPTLVLFVHPGSPGAREALSEVSRLEKRLGRSVAVSVRVYRPAGAQGGWEKRPLWRAANAVTADVAADPEGDVARRFGVSPAETAVVYAPSGRLLFRGAVVSRAGRARAALARLSRLLEAWSRLETRPVVGVSSKV